MRAMPDMIYRPLGRTGIEVSLVSLGTGGQSRLGRTTHQDDSVSRQVVHKALDLGINLFDTAPGYLGTEELLGDALVGIPRTRYIVATKASYATRDGELVEPEDIIASLDQSLRHLRSDYVDGLQFHNVRVEDYEAVAERFYPAARRLKEEGKIRFIGLTEQMDGRNNPRGGDPAHEMATRAAQDGIWDSIGVKYGILNQAAARELFPAARAHGVGILNMSSIRVKLASRQELESLIASWKQRDLLGEDDLPDVDPLGFLVHDEVHSVVEAGYRFAAEPEAISSVVVGTGNPAHLEANVAAVLAGPLPAADSAWLRMLFGHITEGV